MQKEKIFKRVILIRGGGTLVLISFCFLLFYFAGRKSNISNDRKYEEVMYEMYVQKLLKQNLCNTRDAYDACHYLMVPMHYAFQSQNSEYIKMFQSHMNAFTPLQKEEKEGFRSLSVLDRLHILYLVSEYMSLCTQSGYPIEQTLFSFVYDESKYFTVSYTGAWESATQYQDFWEFLDGILLGEGYGNGKSFSNIVTDIDLFLLTILCDLKFAYENNNVNINVNEQIFIKTEYYVDRIFHKEVLWNNDGTWYLQPGAWRDHPDYIYAGLSDPKEIREGEDYRVENCTWDAGHSMRIPMFLRSYQRAAQESKKKDYYGRLLEGFGTTFVKNVLVAPGEQCEYYRMNNYMNGCNGLYRYGYNQTGVGIGPFQNSVCFLLGLYAFCGDDIISNAYCITAQKFPLDAEGKEIYTDPTTIREQNPIFASEEYRQFLCYLAGRLRF